MPTLGIDLQDGFANDSVVVRVGDREVYRRDGVTTNLSISRADGVQVPVSDGPVAVQVDVPSRRLSFHDTLTISGDLHVGVSIEGGRLDVKTSDRPFLYM